MPYYGYYGFDWTYLVLVLPCLILSLWASSSVKSTFNRYSTQYSVRRITGADAAMRVLRGNGPSLSRCRTLLHEPPQAPAAKAFRLYP